MNNLDPADKIDGMCYIPWCVSDTARRGFVSLISKVRISVQDHSPLGPATIYQPAVISVVTPCLNCSH